MDRWQTCKQRPRVQRKLRLRYTSMTALSMACTGPACITYMGPVQSCAHTPSVLKALLRNQKQPPLVARWQYTILDPPEAYSLRMKLYGYLFWQCVTWLEPCQHRILMTLCMAGT